MLRLPQVVMWGLYRVFIPHIPLLTPTDSGFPFILKRRQFPIRPAFCITINKGQGQSLETVGIFLSSPEAIFGHGQLYVALSRVQNPRGLKIMVCGGSEYASGEVLVKNVVYLEIFLTPVEKPLSSCSDLISSFSQDAPNLSSHCILVFSPVKRGSKGDNYERESKVSKIFEFSDSDVIALEDPRECVLLSNDISFGSPDNILCEVIRFLRDKTEHSGVTSVNNFTLAMRLNLAYSIGLGAEEIIPNREDLSIRGTYLRYYASLTTKLFDKFGIDFHLCQVYGDGNCLYRALSHIIFGNERLHHVLKQCMICEFEANPQHYYIVMGRSGIFSEQYLHSYIDRIRSHGEWGTNTELNMNGALARIDVMSIDATDVDPNNWNIHSVYVYEHLEVPLECDPINEGQKLGVIYHRIDHQVGMEHFDPFYQ